MKIKGFTLVEMLIVLVLIGTLVALLLPSLTENRKLAVVSSLKGDLRNLLSANSRYFAANKGVYATNIANLTDFAWSGNNTGVTSMSIPYTGIYDSAGESHDTVHGAGYRPFGTKNDPAGTTMSYTNGFMAVGYNPGYTSSASMSTETDTFCYVIVGRDNIGRNPKAMLEAGGADVQIGTFTFEHLLNANNGNLKDGEIVCINDNN